MAGFDNDIVYANNVDFSGNKPRVGQVTLDGQLLIGSTAAPHIKTGTLASADSSVAFTLGSGTIDLSVVGAIGTIKTLTPDTGGAISPTAGNINFKDTANQITMSGAGSNITWHIPTTFIGPGYVAATTNFMLPATDATHGQLLLNGIVFVSNPGALNSGNTFFGGSGNLTVSGNSNTGLGWASMGSISSGIRNTATGFGSLASVSTQQDNCAYGTNSLTTCISSSNTAYGDFSGASLSTGNLNCYFGASSGQNATGSGSVFAGYQAGINVTGDNCIAIGNGALVNGLNVLTGNNNIAIGIASGSAFATTENSNIVVNSVGVVGDNNTIRIGTAGSGAGQQNRCFIAGITGITPALATLPVSIDANGQLGTSPVSVLPSYTSKAVADSPYIVLSTDYFISLDTVGGAISILLPNAPTTNRIIYIKDRTGHAAANNVSVTTVGGVVTIDGATTLAMSSNFQSIGLIYNGTSYEVF